MRPDRPSPKHVWITTLAEYDLQGNLLREEGYWYDGPIAWAGAPANTTQVHYQFQDDGADANTSTLLGTEDTAIQLELDTTYFLRVKAWNSSNGTAETSQAYQLQYQVGAAGWNDVTTSSSNVRAVDGSDTDGDTMGTERLTAAETYDSTNSQYIEDGLSSAFSIGTDSSVELVYAIQFRSADLTAGEESITFRLQGSVNGDLDAYTVTPTATMPAQSASIPVDAGSLSLAGEVPTLSFGKLLDVPAGPTLTITGHLPDIARGIPVPVGSLSLSGSAPEAARGIPVGAGVLRIIIRQGLKLAGHTPTVSVASAGNVTREPGVGSLSLTGAAPSLLINVPVSVPAGSLTVTGATPTAQEAHIVEDVPVGSVTLTGYVVDLLDNTIRGPPVGALTLTGAAPSAEETHNIDVPVGSLSLTGYTPTVAIGFNIEVPAGSLSLTGYTPSAEEIHNVDVGVGSLTITGRTPTLGGQTLVEPGVGSLTLTGSAPSAEEDHLVDVGAGSLSFTGYAPTATESGDVTVSPDAGSLRIITRKGLQLAGHTPTVIESSTTTVQPGVGSLTIPQYLLFGPRPKVVIDRLPVQPGVGSLRIIIRKGLQFFGHTPTVNPAPSIAVPAGSLTLTGHEPQILNRPAPGVGSLSLTGHEPEAITPQSGTGPKIPVPVGSLLLESDYTDAGSLTLTGYAPSLGELIAVEPGAGSLTITTYGIEVTSQDISQVPAGSLTITTYAPSTLVENPTKIAIPETGSLSITGYTPVVPAQFVTTDTGSLSFTGYSVTLAADYAVPAGSLSLSGYAPTVLATDNPKPDAGSLSLTGYVPEVIVESIGTGGPVLRVVPVGSLTLQGYAPTLVERTPADRDVYLVGAMSDGVYVDAGRIDLQTILYTQGGMSDVVYVQGNISENEVYVRTKIGSATLYLKGEI